MLPSISPLGLRQRSKPAAIQMLRASAFLPLCGGPVHLNNCRAAVAAALMNDHRPRCSFDFDGRSFRIATCTIVAALFPCLISVLTILFLAETSEVGEHSDTALTDLLIITRSCFHANVSACHNRTIYSRAHSLIFRLSARLRSGQHGRARGSALGQMQECATGKFHGGPSRIDDFVDKILRCQAGRYPPRAADQGRTRYQSDHCQGAESYVAAVSGPAR
jgi:hypothetical protein